jgi:hypothetical protein
MGNGTQKEHKIIAELCWEVISEQFPDVKAAVDEITRQREVKDRYYEIINEVFTLAKEEDALDDAAGYLMDSLYHEWSNNKKK